MCEYCEEGKEVFEDSCITLIADSVGLTVVDYRNNENGHEAVVKINFCPMCGRDLHEQKRMTHTPTGRQCSACKHQAQDCSKLDFKSMQPIKQYDQNHVGVKCANFERVMK